MPCERRMTNHTPCHLSAPAAAFTVGLTMVALSAMRAVRKRRSTSGHVAAPSRLSHRRWPLPGEYCAASGALSDLSALLARPLGLCQACQAAPPKLSQRHGF